MLILQRRAGESVCIGDDVELHVVSLTAGRVKLGIAAPRQVPIVRGELLAARRQNVLAASPGSGASLEALVSLLRSQNDDDPLQDLSQSPDKHTGAGITTR